MKTYLRNSQADERSSELVLQNLGKIIVNRLDLEAVAGKYSSLRQNRASRLHY